MTNPAGAERLEKWAPGFVPALAARSSQEQREVALWCARKAIVRAGIGDEPAVAGAIRQIENGDQPPNPEVLSAWVDDYVRPETSPSPSRTSPVAIANLIGGSELRRNPYNSVTARIVSAPHLAVRALIAATDPDPLKAAVEALHYACATFSDGAPDFLDLVTVTFTIELDLPNDDAAPTGRGLTDATFGNPASAPQSMEPHPWFPEHQDNERLAALNKYGRVLVDHGMIAVTAVGANPIYDQDDGLIRTAVDGHLEIRAGSNGQWAGVRLVGHRERPTSALDDNDSWEQSEEAVVTFHGSPVILVGSSTSFGIEPAMRNLDISEGTYGVMVRAKGIAESFTHSPEPTVPVESAPPTEELVQQIRIDMWPAPYPYDLNYDPFTATAT
jgi:hypothetical protein